MHLLAAALLVLAVTWQVALPTSGTTKGFNRVEFDALCRIYLLSKDGAANKTEDLVDKKTALTELREALSEVNDYIIQTNPNRTEFDAQSDAWKRDRQRIPASEQSQVAYRKLVLMKKRIEQLQDVVAAQRQTAVGALEKARPKFQEALWGTTKVEPTNLEVTNTARQTVCAAQDGQAGKTIPLDLVCLCAKSGSADYACGFQSDSTAWAPNGGTGESNQHTQKNWKGIKTHCESQGYRINFSAAGVEQALENFEAALGRQGNAVTTTGFGAFALGLIAQSSPCAAGGDLNTCVDYRGAAAGQRAPIKWYNQLLAAIPDLTEAEQAVGKAVKELSKASALRAIAQTVYLEAETPKELGLKDPLNTPQPAKSQDQAKTAGKETAQEPIVVNAAVISGFILPWTLLI